MNFLVQYALTFTGLPYRWGGENTISGVDCSGLVQEILKSVGMDPPGDQSAQALYNSFEKTGIPDKKAAGSLAFYGKNFSEITHVAFMIDEFRMIEAGGGGSKIKTREDADHANAFVRIRPYNARQDFLTAIGIKYPFV